MLPEVIDKLPRRLSGNYELFHVSLLGLLRQATDGDYLTPHARTAFQVQATTAAQTTLLTIMDGIRQGADAVVYQIAGTSPNVSDAIGYAQQRIDEFELMLRATLMRDVETALGRLRAVSSAAMTYMNAGQSKQGALIKARITNEQELRFNQRDRIGRSWSADRFFALSVRSALVDVYVETSVQQALTEGHTTLRVIVNDLAIPMQIGSDDFNEARRSVFHANTSAWMEAA